MTWCGVGHDQGAWAGTSVLVLVGGGDEGGQGAAAGGDELWQVRGEWEGGRDLG